MIEYFLKWQPEFIGKTFPMWYEGVVCIIVFICFNLVWPPRCFVDDLCQILECFHLIVLLRNSKRSCWHSGGKYNRQMYVRPTCSNLHTERFEVIFLIARWRASAWSDKMNKEQSVDDPSVDSIRVKNMLNSTISMSYPDVVIAWQNIRCLCAIQSNWGSVGEAR